MLQLLKSRRSIRKFHSREVEREKIDIILKSALLSPSSRAKRPWEFIVITDKILLHKLSQCKEHGSQFLNEAPMGIVVIANPKVCDVWIEDASIASTIIQLSAESLGLGSCWIQIRERYGANNVSAGGYIKKALGIPDIYEVECLIAVGYPAEEKRPYTENELFYDKIHFDSY